MTIEIRIYRRHDADLMMLKSYGVNFPKFINNVIDNYVEGRHVRYSLPYSKECSVADISMLRYRVKITNPKSVSLLKSIKYGYRNQFCKVLMRDALAFEPLGVYFSRPEDFVFETSRIEDRNITYESIETVARGESQVDLNDLRHEKDSKRAQKNPKPVVRINRTDEDAQNPSVKSHNVTSRKNGELLNDDSVKQDSVNSLDDERLDNTAIPEIERISVPEAEFNNSNTTDDFLLYPDDESIDDYDDGYEDNPFGVFNEISEEEKEANKKKQSKQMLSMFEDMLGDT